MKNKKMFSLIVVFTLLISAFAPIAEFVFANEPAKDLGDIFTLEVFNVNNEPVESGDVITINDGTLVTLRYGWELINHQAVAGDFAQIVIPEAFKPFASLGGDLNINVEGSSDTINVGVYTLDKDTNLLTFVFNENIVGLDVFDGFVQFNFEFDLSYFTENVRQLIPFNDVSDKEVLVVVVPNQTSNAISKLGVPDSYLDANRIIWTIDILNTSGVNRLGFLSDVLDVGLELDLSSFELTPLTIGYNGGVFPTTSATTTLTQDKITETEQGFEVLIPEIAAYSGYRLKYVTTFTDFNKLNFVNEAKYIYNVDQELTAIASVSGLTRSNIIEKNANVLNSNEIRWTIDVNKSNALLIDAVVEDILAAGLSLKAGSVQVNYINLVNGNWQVAESYNAFTTSTDQQDITFDLGDIQRRAVRITYVTTVEFLGDYKQNNTFTNNAILKEGGATRGGDTSNATIVRAPILSKSGSANVDYDNKTIEWTILVNQANHPIRNWTLTDTLPSGLELLAGSIKVFDGNVDVSDEFIINTTTLPTFSIKPIDSDAEDTTTYTVKYTTNITDFTINAFVNTGTLEGVGVNGVVTTPSTVNPPANAFTKTFESINYNSKTISWSLTVNPTREALRTLKITDTFPNKGLRFIEDSLNVILGTTDLVEDEDFTIGFVAGSTDYKDGFVLEFTSKYNDSNPINALVVINFNTSFDPDLGIDANTSADNARIALNSALFDATSVNGNDYDVTRNADVPLDSTAWFNGKKEGRLVHKNQDILTNGWVSGFGRLIEWVVYTNYLEQNLTGSSVVITDTLAYDGDIDLSSLRIVEYNVNTDGSTSLTANVISADQYSASIDVDGKLTITFATGYDKRLAVVFLTSVPDKSQQNYRNDSTVKIGGNNPLPYTSTVGFSQFNQNLRKAELFARTGTNAFVDEEIDWIITLNESLSIIKNGLIKDTISTGMVLIENSVSVFEVINGVETSINPSNYSVTITNNTIQGDVPTELSIQFAVGYEIDSIIRIKYKTVVVTDTGVINNRVSFSGDTVVETTVTTSQLTARQLSFAGGTSSTRLGSLVIRKTDSVNGDPLVSTFELYYLINGEKRIVEDKTFDTVNGVYRFDNLSYRTYFLREISAPAGYVIAESPIEILLDSTTVDSNRVRTVSVDNVKTLVFEKSGSLDNESVAYRQVGDLISYTLIARNTGDVTLENVEIIDDKFSLLTGVRFYVTDSDGETIADNVTNKEVTLAPTQALVMVAQYAVTQEDIDAGSVENTAFAEATYRGDNKIVSEEDEVVIDALQEPNIEIVKRAVSGQNFTKINDVIEYEFVVTNTGNMTLFDVIITDDLVNNLVYKTIDGVPYVSGSITLAPGQVLVATASYSVNQQDLDRGEVLNIASTEGTDSNETVVDDEDNEDTGGVQEPSITIEKTVLNEDKFTSAGETIFYEFVVRNTGNVTLDGVKINDPLVGTISYISINGVAVVDSSNIVLAPNAVLIARASYIVTQADMNRLEITNEASVSGNAPNDAVVSDEDDAVIEGESQPNIDIVKKATIYTINGIKLSENQAVFVESTQEWIIYEIVATNTGNITLHNVSIEDERVDLINLVYIKIDKDGNEITGITNGEVTLQPNEKLVLTARLNVTQQMINDDFIDNVASTKGYPEDPNEPGTPTETVVEDEDEERVEVNQISTITLDKLLLNEGMFSEVGDIVQYRFIVTNTGNTTLTNVHLIDTLVDEIIYVSINGEALVAGETSVTLQPNDVLYAVASYVITQEDVNAQAVLNTAQVIGTTPKDIEISDEDDALIDGVYDPKISLDKSVVIYNGDQVKANQNAVDSLSDWIMYEVVLVNIGNITLHNVGIVDDKEGLYDIEYKVLNSLGVEIDQVVINGQVTLQPNESLVMTAKLDVTQEILDEGSIFNQAFGTAYPEDPNEPGEPGEEVLEENDEILIDVDQKVMITLKKTSIGVEFFDAINKRIYYLFKIVNEGNTTLNNVMLLDEKIVEFTEFKLNGSIVDASEEGFTLNSEDVLEIIGYTVTTQEDIERGFIYNEAEVVGTDIFEEEVSDTDNDTVVGRKYNSVSLNKTNVIYNENDEIVGQYSSVTDVIVYNIKAVNTGNTIAYDVNVLDRMFVKMTGIVVTHLAANNTVISTFDYEGEMAITLLPGEQIVVVGNYQITEEDLLNERVFNQATAVFNDVDGEVLGDSEDETVSIGLVNLSVKKVDESDTSVVLSGAQFELRNVVTDQKWTITTNDKGIALFGKLEFGQYELREIVAPKGYVLSDEVMVIVIDEDSDSLIEIEFANEAMLPETSDSSTHSGLLLLFLGLLLVQFSGKSSKKKTQV